MTASIIHSDDQYFVVDAPHEIARWRPLVNWLLYIPHGVILHAFRALACVVAFVYWVVLIITGRLHRGLYGMLQMYERYSARSTAFLLGFGEAYAPFDFHGGGTDNDAYPSATLTLPDPPEQASRKLALNFLLAIPHYVVLFVFAIGAVFVAIAGWFTVLVTGAWPPSWRRYLVRVNNYYYRVWTYATMATAQYPRFGL